MVVVAVEPGGVAGVGGPGTLLLTTVAGRPLLLAFAAFVPLEPPVPGLFFVPLPLGGPGSNSISSFGNVEILIENQILIEIFYNIENF